MLKKIILALILLVFVSNLTNIFAQNAKRIEEIRKIYAETNEKIVECEKEGEYSSVYLTELVVNKNNGSYPAVGIFKSSVKFYYTYGDREKNPYPNRLLKISVTTKRSSNTENKEFLFDENEKLIFYFEKIEGEKRIYFTAEKPILYLNGETKADLKNKEILENLREILKEKQNLSLVFQKSLE
jgi:hypothetical protein